MASDQRASPFLSPLQSRTRTRTRGTTIPTVVAAEDDSDSGESDGPAGLLQEQQPIRRNLRPRARARARARPEVRRTPSSSFEFHVASLEQTTDNTDSPQASVASPTRGTGSRRTFNSRGCRRGLSSSNITRTSLSRSDISQKWTSINENDSPARSSRLLPRSDPGSQIEEGNEEDWPSSFPINDSRTAFSTRASSSAGPSAIPRNLEATRESSYQEEFTQREFTERHQFSLRPDTDRLGGADSMDDTARHYQTRAGPSKRSRDSFEGADGRTVVNTLIASGSAMALILYRSETPDPAANDVWPNFRNAAKQPIRYYTLKKDARAPLAATRKTKSTSTEESTRPNKILKRKENTYDCDPSSDEPILPPAPGWPPGALPTELFEEIASYLDRDDIKSMRLVCQEFDRHVSQVLFNTVVVPFNTEIYGMLGQEQKPDSKGKKKVRIEPTALTWKNANGDDVYNGHGLDVFKGFGKHILKFGMSFEVNEDSLAKPPEKSLTERHMAFWGSYDWPFEEYRRFDDVAGLESAADETPRMKTAFSELTRVKELALSIDSGLGWLNGPDRSIRARILPRPPGVFGSLKKIPDRRAQAQKELWEYIESCHAEMQSDIKQATLYKLESNRPLSELQGAGAVLSEQPGLPFLDSHIIHDAVSHDAADFQVPTSFDDPEVLDRFVVAPSSPGTGILFSSAILPTDAGQLMSPIIPASLTKAQKEWLMETEWAQRAFLSSYMLSVIDNPTTFSQVHTLNISQLSDRYIGMLSRHDFWNALPNLDKVNLQVIPGWRTVHKDEAGFVETPRISPLGGIDAFYDLLRNIISQRANIKKLTAGWVTGGEHAEGTHARNKLILPAPLLTAAGAVEQDPMHLGDQLLKFPNVEELTLKNCWMTPAALLQFVKQHDQFSLKKFVLNSVSLTAVLRNGANAQPPNPAQPLGNFAAALGMNMFHIAGVQAGLQGQGNAVNMAPPLPPANPVNPQQLLQFHIQALQLNIQQLQAQPPGLQLAALQAQLQNQIQLQAQAQNHNQPQGQIQVQPPIWHNFAALFGNQQAAQQAAQQHAALAAPPPVQNAPNPQTVLKAEPRTGSWMNVIDIISPGLNLHDFGSEFSQADADRTTSLTSIELVSCGYAKLPYSQFDQSDIDPINTPPRNPLVLKKFNALAPAMLSAKWPLLGEIVQEMNLNELIALNAGWDLETGWRNQEEARAAEFDGLLAGGTGRITGVVHKDDRVVEASAS
ncbi:hypothetical protein K504DRAFT_26505 [Pleomassaria siparia CBS 279.74]|uniref:F-box domain-containing protein n=1 Tax=Pleomassaria siparia CBS 279.74 TaxID=1314801 RepID=A0A6G1KSG1_9PLEO|nr:hypothetical protein K504DRAFT_26505 [Pleomassaria siparia CBS 279.74]